MTKEEILINLKEIPLEDKLFVLAGIHRLIKKDEEDVRYSETVDKYVGKMKTLAGNDFLSGRKRGNVQAKVVLATCLLEDGYPLTTVAHILKVYHSTISHYTTVWNNVMKFPKIYSDVLKLYKNFKELL